MTTQLSQPPAYAGRYLRWAAILFAIGWGVHVLDHLRRGMSASPHAVMVGGMIQGSFVVVAIVMALGGRPQRRWAPEAAVVVGFGSAVLFTYAHLLPTFLPAYQDSFVSGPRIMFAIAGLPAGRSVDRISAPVLRLTTREDISP
jgi:hypothetical protein